MQVRVRKNLSILDTQYCCMEEGKSGSLKSSCIWRHFCKPKLPLPLQFSLHDLIISLIQVCRIYRRVKTITTKKLLVHKKGMLIFLASRFLQRSEIILEEIHSQATCYNCVCLSNLWLSQCFRTTDHNSFPASTQHMRHSLLWVCKQNMNERMQTPTKHPRVELSQLTWFWFNCIDNVNLK